MNLCGHIVWTFYGESLPHTQTQAPFIDQRRSITGWCRSYLLSLLWRKPSLWSLYTHLSYYLPPASSRVSKDESIASQTRSEPRDYYSRTMRSPQPTQILPLCYLAGAPSPWWSKRLQGMNVGQLGRLRFPSFSLQGVWPTVVSPDIDPTRPYYPPPTNYCRTRCSNIPRRSQWLKSVDCVYPGRAQDNSRPTRIVRPIFVLSVIDK